MGIAYGHIDTVDLTGPALAAISGALNPTDSERRPIRDREHPSSWGQTVL